MCALISRSLPLSLHVCERAWASVYACTRMFVGVLYCVSLKMQLRKQSLNCAGKSERFTNWKARLFVALIVESVREVEWVYEQTKS